MKLVVIESPYAPGNGYSTEENLAYLRACMADCLSRGEAPYASHALYTQPGVLDDTIPAERELGMQAGFCWGDRADLGITRGMEMGVEIAAATGQLTEWRMLEGWPRENPLLTKELAEPAQ